MCLGLVCLFLSNSYAMEKIDEAINTYDIAWVRDIMSNKKISIKQKQMILKAAEDIVKDSRYRTKYLFRSPRDLLRLFFGLGVNSIGCGIIFTGLIGIGLCPTKLSYSPGLWSTPINTLDKKFFNCSLAITLIGGATWLFGLLNVIQGWKMKSAYAKLSRARKIQQLISDVEPEEMRRRKPIFV